MTDWKNINLSQTVLRGESSLFINVVYRNILN